jgi:hypothetical protein
VAKAEAAWWESLDDAERAFVRRFLVASGSLKEMARLYAISYPTVRRRLDQLIHKVEAAGEDAGPFERGLRLALARGRLDGDTAEALRRAHRAEIRGLG